MNVAQTKSTMHSLAFGQAMAQAAEDYKKVGTKAQCYCPVGDTRGPASKARSPGLNMGMHCCASRGGFEASWVWPQAAVQSLKPFWGCRRCYHNSRKQGQHMQRLI